MKTLLAAIGVLLVFDDFKDAAAAFRGEGGVVNSDAAVDAMLRWLGEKHLRGSASPL